jgi:hypothetical protein
MVRDLSPSSKSVCTAEPGGSLSISGEGSCGNFDRVLVSDNIRENIISVSRFADQGINSLFTMANRCQLATPLWSEKLRRVGWRDTSNRPDERGRQEHQQGDKNIVSDLVEAVWCAKSLR